MPNGNGDLTLAEVIDGAVEEFDRYHPHWLKEVTEDNLPGPKIRKEYNGDAIHGMYTFGPNNPFIGHEPYSKAELDAAWRAKIAELRRVRTITMYREVK